MVLKTTEPGKPVGRPPTGVNRQKQQTVFIDKELFNHMKAAGKPLNMSGQAVLDVLMGFVFKDGDLTTEEVVKNQLKAAVSELLNP